MPLRTTKGGTGLSEAPAFNRYDFECLTNGPLLMVIARMGPERFNVLHDKTPDSLIEQHLGHKYKYIYFNN